MLKGRSLANATAFAELCLLLNEEAATRVEIAAHCGIAHGTACRWVRLLRSKRLIYIAEWRTPPRGPWIPCYTWGMDENDARRPRIPTSAERSRKSRALRSATFGLGAQ